MLLNGITLGGYSARADEATFSLSGATIEQAAALDGETLTVTSDEGEAVEVFEGYVLASVSVSGDSVRVRAIRRVEESAEAAIHALEENVRLVRETATATQAVANEARQSAEAAAESANPQVVTFARMALPSMAEGMTVSEGASVSTLWPEKKVGDTVKLKEFFWYGGELYRCNQPELTITEGQTPDMNLPALYGHVSVAPDGILVWDADDLTGAPDIYNTGVEVHYPDADGPVYVSGRDGNTSTPGTDQWWTIKED